jgi:hypothetical protein
MLEKVEKGNPLVILAEYEKLIGKEEPVPTVRSASERLRALD